METAVIYEVEQLSFDYGFLSSEERIVVKQKTSEIKTLVRKTAHLVWETGEKLCEVKVILGHGNFGAWLRAEFEWSERTAQNYMAVYKKLKYETVADLNTSLKALALLAQSSEDVQEAVVEAGRRGKPVTPKLVKQIKEQCKPKFDLAVGDYVLTCRDKWARVQSVALNSALLEYEGGLRESLPFSDIEEIALIPDSAWFDEYQWIAKIQKQILFKEAEVLLGVLIDGSQQDGTGVKTVGVQLRIKTTGEVITALDGEGFNVPPQCLYESSWWVLQAEKYLQSHKAEISVEPESEEEEALPPKPFAKGDVC
jgi:hypothetical protein